MNKKKLKKKKIKKKKKKKIKKIKKKKKKKYDPQNKKNIWLYEWLYYDNFIKKKSHGPILLLLYI